MSSRGNEETDPRHQVLRMLMQRLSPNPPQEINDLMHAALPYVIDYILKRNEGETHRVRQLEAEIRKIKKKCKRLKKELRSMRQYHLRPSNSGIA